MPSNRAVLARVMSGRARTAGGKEQPYRVSWRREGYPGFLTRSFASRLDADIWFQRVLCDRSKGVLMDLRLEELMGNGWELRSSGQASRRQRHEARARSLR